MNETIRTILARRSIKSHIRTSVKGYTDQQIRDEDRDLMLKAASYAPSGMGLQPWHFTVIQKKELIDEIAAGAKKAVLQREGLQPEIREKIQSPEYHSLYHAPTAIVLSGSGESRFAMVDCALAGQNILLAAESLGLGSCFTAINAAFFKTAEGKVFAKNVGIPEEYTPYFVVAVGYKAAPPPEPDQRRENIFAIIEQ